MSPAASKAAQQAGRPRREALAARQDALLETALGLFIAHGYATCRCSWWRAARVAIRTIYVKFGGKPGLLDAVIAAERQRHRSELDALELDALDVRARFERLARHLAGRCVRPVPARRWRCCAPFCPRPGAKATIAKRPSQKRT